MGRLAAAAKAVELGYGIEADPGPSGRLGGWAISGIPKEAWEVHATRSAQIDAAVGPDASYRSRAVAARATRERKSHDSVEDLGGRWRVELAEAGYPALELTNAVERAGLAYCPPQADITEQLAEQLLGPEGRLAQQKIFNRDDVIVAAAPHLHGLPLSYLDEAVGKVLSHENAVALSRVAGAREPVWAAACVIEDERHIAELADRLAEREVARVEPSVATRAVRRLEIERGTRLTDKQAEVAKGLLSSGHALDLVVGVAGSGKTTTLAAVRAGFESAGYQVLGTATSGQAAQALGHGAGVEARTVASLTWRLEHGRQALSPKHVVILDEAAMTSDAEVGKLLGAVQASGAKAIVVGDYHQLDAVGPGGALEAIAARHPGHVWTLRDNLRQRDPGERHALDHLRAGHVGSAVAWYEGQGRVHAAPTRDAAIRDMVNAWAVDVAAGRDAVLLAYHRDVVEALNRTARSAWQEMGRLAGPELEAPGGRRYRAGDRVIAMAPGPGGAWPSSQRAVVNFVEADEGWMLARTPQGRSLHLGPEQIGLDNLAHGYAMTAHRSQGSTTDVTYALEDGGGRELAYVAMSRARGESHVHVVAPSAADAVNRLEWAWGHERRQSWALDHAPELSMAEMMVERRQLLASVPPDHSAELERLRHQQQALDRDTSDLHQGTGRWAGTAGGQAARELAQAALERQVASEAAVDPDRGGWARRKARRQLREADNRFDRAMGVWERDGQPYARQLEARHVQLSAHVYALEEAQQDRAAYLAGNPELPRRVAELDRELEREQERDRRERFEVLRQREQDRRLGLTHDLDREVGRER